MPRSTRLPRPGVTLLELIAVMAVLVILGAILLPTLNAFRGDTRLKAATDTFAGRVAEGRVRAMESGQPYQLSIHQDGRQLRLAPFALDLVDVGSENAAVLEMLEDTFPPTVMGMLVSNSESVVPTAESGWLTVATFQSDGSCKEDNVLLEFSEPGSRSLFVHLRGLTGVVSVHSADSADSLGYRQ
ncbi:MAG: prepilin-type N-terminal cleavage/methylation domain-containing protein [Bacteroidales bacterium]|nr:prepilin-type N-terminal cleavage/methylation domain-containing protein [Bacteroidales bacterium]